MPTTDVISPVRLHKQGGWRRRSTWFSHQWSSNELSNNHVYSNTLLDRWLRAASGANPSTKNTSLTINGEWEWAWAWAEEATAVGVHTLQEIDGGRRRPCARARERRNGDGGRVVWEGKGGENRMKNGSEERVWCDITDVPSHHRIGPVAIRLLSHPKIKIVRSIITSKDWTRVLNIKYK